MEQPDREGFNEASLGEGQSENPPADPEYLRDAPAADEAEGDGGPGESAEGGAETYGGDQDAEGTAAPDQAREERDQAEG